MIKTGSEATETDNRFVNFILSFFHDCVSCLVLIYKQNLENLHKPVLWLSRNNAETIAVIFGEESQFCVVYFSVNKMNFVLKRKFTHLMFRNTSLHSLCPFVHGT